MIAFATLGSYVCVSVCMCEHLQLDNVAICVHKILKILQHLDFPFLICSTTSTSTVIISFSVLFLVINLTIHRVSIAHGIYLFFSWSYSVDQFEVMLHFKFQWLMKLLNAFFCCCPFFARVRSWAFFLSSIWYISNSLHAIDNYGFPLKKPSKRIPILWPERVKLRLRKVKWIYVCVCMWSRVHTADCSHVSAQHFIL